MDAARLLNDLCVTLGYCLLPDDQARLVESPPTSVDAFTDAVIVAEGLDPGLIATEQRQQVRRGLLHERVTVSVRPPGWRLAS